MYQVTGAYVTAKWETMDGPMVTGFLKGAMLPASVDEKQIHHLLDVGLIAEVEEAPVAAKPVAETPVKPPAAAHARK